MPDQDGKTPKQPRKTAATLLVEIAGRIWDFGSVAEQRGHTSGVPGDDPVALYYFAALKEEPRTRRPLEDIRPDLAMEYEFEHGRAASAGQLGDAMSVLTGRARKNRVADTSMSEGEEILRAAGLNPVPSDRGLSLVTRCDGCPLPENYVIPEPYLVAEDGVYLLRDDGDGQARVTWGWLFPVRIYVDPAGDQLVELAWRDGHRWVSRLIRRAIAKSGRKLVAEVGDAGLPVIEAEARQAERWLAAAEAANHRAIPRDPVARQLGWQADGKTFVTGQDAPWRVEPAYSEQADPLAAHRSSGTMAGWQEVLKGAQGYMVVRAGVCAGLAAALLEALGLDSFSLDISGASTRGKSITAMAAMSCWADPNEKADAMLSWQVRSIFPIEKRLNLVNGLLVVIDETRLVKDPAIVDTVLYQVPKNHGVPRGGGWPNMIPWRAIVLTTGEQPATSFTTHQGASARVLSITQHPPFGTESAEGREAAERVKRGVEANFGIAGPAFIARLQAVLAADGGRDKLCARHDDLTGQLRGDTDMSGRRAPLIASLALACELATEWEIMPGEPMAPEDWIGLFTAPDLTDDRPQMALGIVREIVAAKSADLWHPGRDWQPQQGWIGRYHTLKDVDTPTVALLPARLRQELKRHGYDYDAVLPGWREDKILHESGTGRTPYLHTAWLGPTKTRMLILTPGVIEVDPPARDEERPPPEGPSDEGEDVL
jgi:hypothetical protein